MNNREFKDKVYEELARITKAMSNPHRLEIIDLLAQGEFSVELIANSTNLSVANASQHLQVLKSAQLVDITRHGNFIHYRLANGNVFKAWRALRELGLERIASIEKFITDFRTATQSPERVTIDQLLEKMKERHVTIIDVRPEAEFNNGHIPNAISIPIEQLTERLKELPKRSEIIAYCRGPFCVYSDEAVVILVKNGYQAKRLEEGFPDWQAEDLPVQISLD